MRTPVLPLLHLLRRLGAVRVGNRTAAWTRLVRAFEADPLDGDFADVAPVHLAQEDEVDGVSLLLSVGALEGVPCPALRVAEIGVDQAESVVSCQAGQEDVLRCRSARRVRTRP